jgi:hypothetical protein
MAGINTLDSFYRKEGREKLDNLLKNYVVIVEKFSACNFYLQRSGDQVSFFRRDNQNEISLVDRTFTQLYEKAISYFSNFDHTDFPENYRFGFEYFPNNKPAEIEYSSLPENSLVLTRIMIKNSSGKTVKVIDDTKVLEKWANILDVSHNTPLFSGELSEDQRNSIIDMVSNSSNNVKNKFLSLFESYNSPAESNTFDSFIFKIISPGSVEKFKFVDISLPIVEKASQESRRGSVDSVSILILDLLDFIEGNSLPQLLSGSNSEEKYIDLISQLYNKYMSKNENSVAGMTFDKKDFADSPEFDVNLGMIKNPTTLSFLEKSDTNKTVFKILLNSFRKYRDIEMANDVLTPEVLKDFNIRVDEIKALSQKVSNDIKTFSEFVGDI